MRSGLAAAVQLHMAQRSTKEPEMPKPRSIQEAIDTILSETVTTTEAAVLMGVGHYTVLRRIQSGRLPVFRVGTAVRISREDALAAK